MQPIKIDGVINGDYLPFYIYYTPSKSKHFLNIFKHLRYFLHFLNLGKISRFLQVIYKDFTKILQGFSFTDNLTKFNKN